MLSGFFPKLSLRYRILSLVFIILSAVASIGVSKLLDSKGLPHDVSGDDRDIYIYCEDSAGVRVKPFFTSDNEFRMFIPCPAKEWLWSIPKGASLYIDGVLCNNGDKMTVTDDGKEHAIVFTLDGATAEWYMTCMCADNISVASINLDSDDFDTVIKEETPQTKVTANMTILDEKGAVNFDDTCKLGGHGNATWMKCSKKSFEVKLADEASLLNMGSNSGWNIIANAMDPSNLKNSVVYEAARKCGYEYSVGSQYINLYINGMYNGLYLLTEKPVVGGCVLFTNDLGNNRTRLAESEYAVPVIENYGTNDEIRYYSIKSAPSGAPNNYFMEFDRYDETLGETSSEAWFMTDKAKDLGETGYQVLIKYPRTATQPEVSYIMDYVKNAEAAIYSEDGINPETGLDYRDCMDLYSWAMSYLFMDFFAYQDYSAGSLFFYKKGNDDLLYSGPIWDYDKCMTDDFYSEEPFEWYEKNNVYLWYGQMGHFDDFHNQVIDNYRLELSPILQDIIENKLPEWRRSISLSEEMDEIRWRIEPGYEVLRGDLVEKWLIMRKDLFDSVWIRGESSPYADNIYP